MTMGAQIPVIAEKPLAACGCRKLQIDALGDYLCTCTAHSEALGGESTCFKGGIGIFLFRG